MTLVASSDQHELRLGIDPLRACRILRGRSGACVLLEGSPGHSPTWDPGPLLALDPRPERCAWTRLAEELDRRRRSGGPAETGLAVLLPYESLRDPTREVLAWRVDRSLRFLEGGSVRFTARAPREGDGIAARDEVGALLTRIDSADRSVPEGARPTASPGRPRTSLSRERYLRAVERVKEHIRAGDIYQANLCLHFSTRHEGDPLTRYEELSRGLPAPRSAFVAAPGLALASISPETFLRLRLPDHIETHPIKGTRPRGADAAADRAAARELLGSAKDRAELLMIVDLERNDLGRICRPGTVRTRELAGLRSYATVHHLVGRVEGRLRDGVGVEEILAATFPGGSITGAPKRRAMQILDELEPGRRGPFTGCLFWFGDDGGVESSILIRTLVFSRGRARLGAGGGIVADSDPEQEWLEANHKARALARVLGFDPAEVS